MSNQLYRALVTEAIGEVRIDLEPVSEDGTMERVPTGDRALRGQVRLLIKAVVDSRLADHYDRQYAPSLRRVPRVTSKAAALRASNRLMEVSEWAGQDSGFEAASSWMNAAQLASWLVEDYSGLTHQESYQDLAGWYFGALRSGGWNEQVFLKLLESLNTKES
ncbi:hypothetical protein [Streptomyces sp. NPDC054838]